MKYSRNKIFHVDKIVTKTRKFKAIMLDVDGTLIPFEREGVPSGGVIEAVSKASKVAHVGIATSRPYYILKHIADALKLTGPSIINGGAQIMDMENRKILWEQIVEHEDVLKSCRILKEFNLSPLVLQDDFDVEYEENMVLTDPLQVWAHGIDPKIVDQIVDKLSDISTIAVVKPMSWEEGKVDIIVCHAKATKQHGIFEVAKILNIETSDIIGVGDNYNDFPLLLACGLKVAMGNAVEDLKAIADYVAPSVEEDGVVDIINRFIL